MTLQPVTSGMYRQITNNALIPIKDHPELDTEHIAIGKQLGREIAQKIITSHQINENLYFGRDNWHEINYIVSLGKNEKSLKNERPYLQWKYCWKVNIYTNEIPNKDQKAEKIFLGALVDIAAEKIQKEINIFKKSIQKYNFFCFGTIISSIENHTTINKIMLKIWREEKKSPITEESDLLTYLFFGTLALTLGYSLAHNCSK